MKIVPVANLDNASSSDNSSSSKEDESGTTDVDYEEVNDK